VYILGHRPYEFGLVPDTDGFVTYKELIQAIHEEPDWHYVRKSHINEVLVSKNRSLFQYDENKIRSTERLWQLELDELSQGLPKVLYISVRRKAHAVVFEKGLKSFGTRYLVLSPNQDMALRMGKRRDQWPVMLEIMAEKAADQGVSFYGFGNLFLSPQIPPSFVSGPPVPKEVLEGHKDVKKTKEEIRPRPIEFTPGSFHLDVSRDPDLSRRVKGKKHKGWKEEARKIRRGR